MAECPKEKVNSEFITNKLIISITAKCKSIFIDIRILKTHVTY